MIPEPCDPGKRAGGPDNPSAPRTYKTCCPKCDNSVSGLASGRPARFCVEHPVLDKHQEYYSLIAPRMMLNTELAFHFCRGDHFTPKGELAVPPIHRKPKPERPQKPTGKFCRHCGKPFKPERSNGQLYCSERCHKDHWNRQRRELRAKRRVGDAQ